jgi:hypothetical protein
MDDKRIEIAARAIFKVRPDCQGKRWPIETPEQRRAYPHNPIAAVDLCFAYAKAALQADKLYRQAQAKERKYDGDDGSI